VRPAGVGGKPKIGSDSVLKETKIDNRYCVQSAVQITFNKNNYSHSNKERFKKLPKQFRI